MINIIKQEIPIDKSLKNIRYKGWNYIQQYGKF